VAPAPQPYDPKLSEENCRAYLAEKVTADEFVNKEMPHALAAVSTMKFLTKEEAMARAKSRRPDKFFSVFSEASC
jgi:hypothetical protein